MHRAGTETDSDQTICPPDVVTLKSQCVLQLVWQRGIETRHHRTFIYEPHGLPPKNYAMSVQRLSLIYLVKEHSGRQNQNEAHKRCASF